MAQIRRRTTAAPTKRTMARRAKRQQAADIAESLEKRQQAKPEREGLGQAKTWDRKLRRYEIAGLCRPCAAQAAWGHAIGFQKISDPCAECQPIVNALPDDGPQGSKWRKCLLKLEYMSEDEIKEVFADA